MKYLFIATETTGLPKDDSLSPMVTDNWPRLVSFAYILCDERDIVDRGYFIIKPNKFIIPIESTKIHGITTAEAVSKGIVLSEVLDIIRPLIEKCDYIVGHNVVFDVNILNADFYRYNMTLPVSLKPYYCTMMLSKDYCGLPNNKYPTLEELSIILRGEAFKNAHNAMEDTKMVMECFWILIDSCVVNSQNKKQIIKIYPTEDNISWAAKQVSTEYAAKAYAYLTFASNLLYNKSNFLKSEDDNDSFSDRWLDSFYRIDDSILKRLDNKARKEFENYSKDCRFVKKTNNRDWLNSMFNFLKLEINKTSTSVIFDKFDNSRSVFVCPYLRFHLKELEKEIGGKEMVEEFKLKNPEFSHISLILNDESSWVDIAIEAVKSKIQPTNGTEYELLSQEAENYFLSMIEYFNNVRETERSKRIDEWNNRIDEWNRSMERSLDPVEMKKNLEAIKNYSSPYTTSSSGCMLFLSILAGIGSSLCCLIAVFFF